MRLLRVFGLLPVIGLLLAAAEAQKDEGKSPIGDWTIIAIKSMGRSAPDDLIKGLTVTFNAQKSYAIKAKDQVVEQGRYQINTAKTPWTIDFAIEKGSDAGKHQLGIFTIDGETLTLSVAEAGSEKRPTTLDSKADTPGLTYVLRRAGKER